MIKICDICTQQGGEVIIFRIRRTGYYIQHSVLIVLLPRQLKYAD